MAWSLLNAMLAEKVKALLDDPHIRDCMDGERAMSRETAEAAVHAIIWAHSSRSGSTASAYALSNLYDVLGLETWTYKDQSPEPQSGDSR